MLKCDPLAMEYAGESGASKTQVIHNDVKCLRRRVMVDGTLSRMLLNAR